MAICAICRSEVRTGGRVHRVIRLLPGRQVAARSAAARGQSFVHAARVARRACNPDVQARQGERRHRCVIELPIHPANRVVAGRADRRVKPALDVVHRRGRGIELIHVA